MVAHGVMNDISRPNQKNLINSYYFVIQYSPCAQNVTAYFIFYIFPKRYDILF